VTGEAPSPPPQPSPASAGEGAEWLELFQQAIDVVQFRLWTGAFGVAATEFFFDGASVLAFALFGDRYVAALVGAGTALAESGPESARPGGGPGRQPRP
jgi:hypothetical protein